MSAVRTRSPLKEALVSDDIESFMNLALWFSARFHKTTITNLYFHLQLYFRGTDVTADSGAVPLGSHERYTCVEQGMLSSTMIIKHPRLRTICALLLSLCGQHYRAFTSSELELWSLPGQEFHVANDNDDPVSARRALPPAKTLDTHDSFIDVFKEELDKTDGWDPNDKGEDRFANMVKDYEKRYTQWQKVLHNGARRRSFHKPCREGSSGSEGWKYTSGTLQAVIRFALAANTKIARPLEQYTDAEELCRVLLDCLKAHEQAWTKASIVHGDINDSNILIVGEGPSDSGGLLVDWDLCKYDFNPGQPPMLGCASPAKQRLGTWCFMSAVRTRFPFKPVQISDDIESFMNIVLWFSLRFHKHLLGSNLSSHLETYYLGTMVFEKAVLIGCYERYHRVMKSYLPEIFHPRLSAIGEWLMGFCGQHYRTFSSSELQMWSLPGVEGTVGMVQDHPPRSRFFWGPPPERTLDTHDRFVEVYVRELACTEGWDPEDKKEDMFKGLVVQEDPEKTVTIGSFQPFADTHNKRPSIAEPEGETSISRASKRLRTGRGNTPLGPSHAESGGNM
ncbi:hypothetical protein K474DRAFT_1673607 [Panus rudis PR-1116 ss-1]|nr:hypothetical protein K474DRAFT_1673607 [Panus rudis PR-1116 ss-1]